MANITENEKWKTFIQVYRSLPEIWQVKSPQYKDKNKRNKAWQTLLTHLKEIDGNASLDDVKKRINNMRTCYRREVKKMEKSEKSGAGIDDVYESTLWYFDELNDFLRDQETQITGVSNMDDSDVDDELPKRKKIITSNDQSKSNKDEYLRKAVEHLDYIKQKKDSRDEATSYAEAWAVSYRKLNEEQKLYAKKAIDEVFILGQLQQLSLYTISSPSSRSSSRASTPFSQPYPYAHGERESPHSSIVSPQPPAMNITFQQRPHEESDYTIQQLFSNPTYQ